MNAPVRVRTRTAPPAQKSERRQGSRASRAPQHLVPENAHVQALKEYANSRQMSDPFKNQYAVTPRGGHMQVLEPEYNFNALLRIPEESSILEQCIAAMITNIDGHGYRLEYVGEKDGEESTAAKAEKITLENLLDFPNDEYSLQELRNRCRRDYETLGVRAIEVGRDRRGRVVMLNHIPAHTVRLTLRENNPVEVDVKLPRDGKTVTERVQKRFRRYLQIIGATRVWFKEYGDPRIINPNTGEEDPSLRFEDSATEIIYDTQYRPGSPYGKPRWFHTLPAILGSRQSELTNLDFFNENAIPALAVMVAGGALTQASIDALEEHITAVRGRRSMNRVVVLEATGDENLAADNGTVAPPRMELRPLAGERQKDGLFQDYEKNCETKVRSSFRLPPLFVGRSEDMTYATAQTSFEVAESQVFAPERQQFDDMMNLKVLGTYDARFWAFRSNAPRLSSQDEKIKAVTAFDGVGAMTPNIAISMANEFFDLEIPLIEEDWGNFPFELVKAMVTAGKLKIDGDKLVEVEELPVPPGLQPGANGEPAPADPKAPSSKAKPVGDPEDDDPAAKAQEAREAVVSSLHDLRRVIKEVLPAAA